MERAQLAAKMHLDRKRFWGLFEFKGPIKVLPPKRRQVSRRGVHLLAGNRAITRGGGGLCREAGQDHCRGLAPDLLRRSEFQSLAAQQTHMVSKTRAGQVPDRQEPWERHHRDGCHLLVHDKTAVYYGSIHQQSCISKVPIAT